MNRFGEGSSGGGGGSVVSFETLVLSVVWDPSAQSLVFLPFWEIEIFFRDGEPVDFFSPEGFLLIYVSSAFLVSPSVLESHYRQVQQNVNFSLFQT